MSSEDHSSTKEFKSFILLRLTSPWRAEAALAIKEGDEACAKVISILEESASYLEEDTHNQLQRRYDQFDTRLSPLFCTLANGRYVDLTV